MASWLARVAYSTLLRLATPAYLLRLWWRGAKEPLYRSNLGQRLGLGAAAGDEPGRVWLHAVSLGETRAAAPLVEALRAQRPGLRLLLTHGTATGRAAGAALLQPGDAQAWLPYDTPGAVRRFLRQHRPALGVVMETEVWPNLLFEAHAAKLPVVLANARLSERSQRKGDRLAALMHPAMACFAAVLAQTQADAVRLRASGAAHTQVLGNLKFDMQPAPAQLAQGQQWRLALGRPVVMAAATREGEEQPLLQAWATATHEMTAKGQTVPLLLLVPRHPQRFDEVAAAVQQAGLTLQRRSSFGATAPAALQTVQVLLGDSLGEMPLYYAMAHLALLGGSFAPLGGQNLIEAAACGCPLLMGPHTFNFAQAAEQALAAGAAQRVADVAAAVQLALQCVQADRAGALAQQAAAAQAFAQQHRGAAQRTAQVLINLLR